MVFPPTPEGRADAWEFAFNGGQCGYSALCYDIATSLLEIPDVGLVPVCEDCKGLYEWLDRL